MCVRVRLCVHLVAVVAATAASPAHLAQNVAQRHLSIQKFNYAMLYTVIEFDGSMPPEDGHVIPTCTAQVRMSLISMKVAAAA